MQRYRIIFRGGKAILYKVYSFKSLNTLPLKVKPQIDLKGDEFKYANQ